MSEAALWQRCRAGLTPHGHLVRVETGMLTVAGVPDVNYCFDGVEGWLELKYGKIPKRPSTVVFKSQRGLDPEQVEWQVARRTHGGVVWNLIQLDKTLLLINGEYAPRINRCTFEELRGLAVWECGGAMSVEGWAVLAKNLRCVF